MKQYYVIINREFVILYVFEIRLINDVAHGIEFFVHILVEVSRIRKPVINRYEWNVDLLVKQLRPIDFVKPSANRHG